MRCLARSRQPLNAADEEVVLHCVEVERVAVARERNVKVTRDYSAGQHEVRVRGGCLRLRWRVPKIALDLFNFLPCIATA